MGMGIQTAPARGWAVALASALAVAIAGAGATVGTAAAAATSPRLDGGTAHVVSPRQQHAARAFWTPSRMAAATPLGTGRAAGAPSTQAPGIPSPKHFSGVPTVGALFMTTGKKQHFCTASVVKSSTEDLILTAAHCVYSSTYASNIAFVPGYHAGNRPYGTWPVREITVAAGWRKSHDPNLDFAFLAVSPPKGTKLPIQQVTGALRLGINLGYYHPIQVIGYNNSGDVAIRCATKSFKFEPDQMKFYCRYYQDGTSGGPWIIGYNHRTGRGTVFGVIGGYEQGGDYTWSSYSAYFSGPARALFKQAEASASRR
jgi:V8-like Glu-specific endopeptidase